MSLDEEIEWWNRQAFKADTDAALISFGVATGLKMAKADYGATSGSSYPTNGNPSSKPLPSH